VRHSPIRAHAANLSVCKSSRFARAVPCEVWSQGFACHGGGRTYLIYKPRIAKRPKVGRTARLRGLVETTEPAESRPPALQQKIDATVAEMRKTGAPDSDINQFMKDSGVTAP
jgi:hypothetical protein